MRRWTIETKRQQLQAAAGDDTLFLLFCCCHPDLAPASQVALTLRATTVAERDHLVRRAARARAASSPSGA